MPPASTPVTHAPRVESPRFWRWAALIAGWIVPHSLLYGSALAGSTVLIPLDLLALPGFYLPQTPEYAEVRPHNFVLSDLVLVAPFSRDFCAKEFRSGRIPLWAPDNFAGAPFATWPKYSLFELPYYVFPSPATLAWMQLLQNVVCAWGAFAFARKVLQASFWPAALGSWCAPWTGFFMLWQGYPLTAAVALLPWLLLATEGAARRPFTWRAPCLALVTAAVVLSAQVDVVGQTVIVSGLYALWRLFDEYGARQKARAARASLALSLAWLTGFLLAAPYLLPLAEYAGKGARMERRAAGHEERPPVGLAALPQIVVPNIYGTTEAGMVRLAPGNQLESSAACYTGLLATLVLAPLSWACARRRSQTIFWSALCVIGLAWTLNLPGAVELLRLPGLNMFSHNRFVFASSWAILCLAILGFDTLREDGFAWRGEFWAPVLLLAVFGVWLQMQAWDAPEPIASELERAVRRGANMNGVADLEGVRRVQRAFFFQYASGAAWCWLGCLAWLAAGKQLGGRSWFFVAVGAAWLAELMLFAHAQQRQGDPRLYYPRIAALSELAQHSPGRMLGIRCLPPKLNQSHGLRDIRGYDAADPQLLLQLLALARDDRFSSPDYAQTQGFVPRMRQSGERVVLPPVLNLLNVRYLLFREEPPPGLEVLIHRDDYWIVENKSALPRAFVPRKVAPIRDAQQMLRSLGQPAFDPAELAYVEEPLDLADDARGQAEIVSETATRIEIELDMETPGLVVLADMWDAGWRAALDEVSAPIVRVDSALRGVSAPAGRHRLVFYYAPDSFTLGVRLACGALVALACGFAVAGWTNRAGRPEFEETKCAGGPSATSRRR